MKKIFDANIFLKGIFETNIFCTEGERKDVSSARDIRFQICELYLYVNTDPVSDEK